jgi:hypothetical protein
MDPWIGPALDIFPISPKHVAISPVSPLQSPVLNSSIRASPALGEVKGWFSNLFNWKTQSYALGSSNDVWSTRTEVRRVLEQLGVSVHEEFEIFRCLMEDHVIQRQVKFRVHVSSGGGSCHYPSPNPQTPAGSPRPASNRFSVNVDKISHGSENSYASVIVLLLEKGSVSTFRNVYRRLREEWRLDPNWDIGCLSPSVGVDDIGRG